MTEEENGSSDRSQAAKTRPFTSARWWENYLVRYFVGTVVGAALILYLADPSSALLKSALWTSTSEPKDASIKSLNLFVMVALGLAYCYAASAPMLSLHAVRAQLDLIQMKAKRRFWTLTIAFAVAGWALFVHVSSFSWFSKEAGSLSVFCLVAATQIALIIGAQFQTFSRIESFYRNLSAVRAKTDQKVTEYVESYRHLREHSNAYAILVLEVVLALALSVASKNWQRVVIIFLWLGPPAYCWLIATVLEARYAAHPEQ